MKSKATSIHTSFAGRSTNATSRKEVMKLLTLIILATLALGSKAPKGETVFSGKISATSSMMPIVFGLNIEFRIDTFVIARAMVQQDGSFTISAPSNTGFDMYYSGVGIRETYVQAIQPAIIDSVSLAFKLPKVYKSLSKILLN